MFVTGGTGYLGRRLLPLLLRRGHHVRALARPGSEQTLAPGTELVLGDALNHATWASRLVPCDTLVHLVGTPHPSPWKAPQFLDVDLRSIRESMAAVAATSCVRHVVYVSVAHPAPVMRAYIEARRAGEATILAHGLPTTLIRPWYVLGPGHRWPMVLLPIYAIAGRIPATAERAARLGLVTREEMVAALVHAVEHPPDASHVVDVPGIRASAPVPPLDAAVATR